MPRPKGVAKNMFKNALLLIEHPENRIQSAEVNNEDDDSFF